MFEVGCNRLKINWTFELKLCWHRRDLWWAWLGLRLRLAAVALGYPGHLVGGRRSQLDGAAPHTAASSMASCADSIRHHEAVRVSVVGLFRVAADHRHVSVAVVTQDEVAVSWRRAVPVGDLVVALKLDRPCAHVSVRVPNRRHRG